MRTGYRSFFWPAALILVGVFALLINARVIPVERLDRLLDLWPLILIVIGLEIVVRRALHGGAAELAAVLIVLLAIGGAAAYVALGPATLAGGQKLDAAGKVGSLDHATVHVEVGAANITVQGSRDIGDDLFRAHFDYSGGKPEVRLDTSTGELTISQANTTGFFFQSRRFVLNLQLNSTLPWKIAVDGGASTDTFNLSGIHVTSIDINAGASREDITLGAPSGTVPITINGGAVTVNVHRPKGVAVSVTVSGGAANLTFDGRQSHAIGTLTAQTSDYDSATDRYQIQVSGGASNANVDSSAPTG
ncbi:MAG: hypothetical protein AUG06_02300 [Actinobacteria bacterium 13_1_20CM_2_65_11]|nr:MAG: hypothetical protein AUG06_02300 [Actinobacteria bacterium 13_1_20CM_2_65_11]